MEKIEENNTTRNASATAIAPRPKSWKLRSLFLRFAIEAATRLVAIFGETIPLEVLIILFSVFIHDVQGDKVKHQGHHNQCQCERKGR